MCKTDFYLGLVMFYMPNLWQYIFLFGTLTEGLTSSCLLKGLSPHKTAFCFEGLLWAMVLSTCSLEHLCATGACMSYHSGLVIKSMALPSNMLTLLDGAEYTLVTLGTGHSETGFVLWRRGLWGLLTTTGRVLNSRTVVGYQLIVS